MLYFIKWIYLWILPLGGIVVLLVFVLTYQFRRRSAGRYGLLIVLAVLYALSVKPAAVLLMEPLETMYAQPAAGEVSGDVIVLLGGGAAAGVRDVDGDGQLGGSSANRLLTAVRLQRSLQLPVLLSGGPVLTGSADESAVYRRIMTALGVDEAMIFVDGKSRNTAENAAFSSEICRSRSWRRLIVVTSAFHMPRAVQYFTREGMEVIPYPCDYRTGGTADLTPYSFIPQADTLADSCLAIKEYAALAAAAAGWP